MKPSRKLDDLTPDFDKSLNKVRESSLAHRFDGDLVLQGGTGTCPRCGHCCLGNQALVFVLVDRVLQEGTGRSSRKSATYILTEIIRAANVLF
jgi:hypothetical protein